MPFKNPRAELETILENIARIERYVGGLDEEAFMLNDEKRDAVERCLERISEAARRLGEQAEILCPGIPWPDIRGLGNRLRHGYDSINPDVIWSTVTEDVGPLQLAVHSALNRIEGPEPEPG